ncbi:MAG: 1-acyl-sn-glycerol-3-phosphate acyltransferase [Clostridia bacterium]|nr:1-acyl-sn-glycerol-3-phosphate acyltransferase [Clostridia bacterium]
MKIKIRQKPYDDVLAMEAVLRRKPKKPNLFFRCLLKLVSLPDLWAVHFRCRKIGMDKLGRREPCLYLMNHSSFVDLEIVAGTLFPRAFQIVATNDSFVGKSWLMRMIGCIPTKKFVSDMDLVRDIFYTVRTLRSSVVMYPEASYSFDGTATPLPDSVGKLVKRLGIPVVMIRTYGAFTRDPLYNNLQRRKVRVSADMEYLLSPKEIQEMSSEEIQNRIESRFRFDHFRWQKENGVRVSELFRADYLNRVLYRCATCQTEGRMVGKGILLRCEQCGKTYELDEYGTLRAKDGDKVFSYVTDWYAWERERVRQELEEGCFRLELDVDICVGIDFRCIYRVGTGRLVQTAEGFHLTGCDGSLDYRQSSKASYSLYSDFNWYEVGDMICLGNTKLLYYCFPQGAGDVVAKARMAAEEAYKMSRRKK